MVGAHDRLAGVAEIPSPPQPPRPEPQRAARLEPLPTVSRASEWVAGLRSQVAEFAEQRRGDPFVQVTLDDGEALLVRAMTPRPGGDFVTFTAYDERGGERLVVVRLEAIRRVDVVDRPPRDEQRACVFHPRPARVGFTAG